MTPMSLTEPLHVPTMLLLSVVVMAAAASITSFFGLSHRVYRGYAWWVAAMWLAAGGGALQLLRARWPEAAVPGNLLLLSWPVLIQAGMRRFCARGRLPGSQWGDALLFVLCFAGWLATWASHAADPWRAIAFGLAMSALFLNATVFLWRLPERPDSPALKTMAAVMLLQTLIPLARLGWIASTLGHEQLEPFALMSPLVLMPMMIGMLFTVYLCQVLTHERTEGDLRETQRQLRVLADIDMLTQVPNRRHFEELAGAALHGASDARAVLMLFDIDHFKAINDSHGHAAGDEALRRVARCARETLRTRDVLGRLGGDEFMLLLPGASVDDALMVAERISDAIDAAALPADAFALSLSFGVVQVEPDESLESAQHRADLALYEAKRLGRRRAVPARLDDDGATVYGSSRPLGLAATS
ncbi:diguanylate cyclase [Caldimonas sp. KR1-144]|uniref:GGDEF domain-containing protein n=1 Tax=Caldimonas sp. KR1-144 TaxID=3400911 RepID=UPI003C073708